jgi:hypothetical protein
MFLINKSTAPPNFALAGEPCRTAKVEKSIFSKNPRTFGTLRTLLINQGLTMFCNVRKKTFSEH